MNDSNCTTNRTTALGRSPEPRSRRTFPLMPDRPRVGWLFIVTITLIVTCLLTLASIGRPGAPTFPVLHDRQTISWVTWIILAPGIIVAARRFPFGDGTPFRWLWRHIAFGAVFSI